MNILEDYWKRVSLILLDEFRKSPDQANSLITDYRKKFEEPNDGYPPDGESIMHYSALDTACEIMRACNCCTCQQVRSYDKEVRNK